MPEDDDLDAPDPEPQPESHDLKRLREKAKGADDANARAEAAERKLAFVQAGIDPEDPRQRYFAEGYKGDLNPDAIKAEATSAGFLVTEPVLSEPQGMTEQERAAFRATSEAAAAGSQPQPEVDIYEPFRKANHRGGESPEQFGVRLAEAVAAAGGEVSYDGPFRSGPGDTGIVGLRPGTPEIRPNR